LLFSLFPLLVGTESPAIGAAKKRWKTTWNAAWRPAARAASCGLLSGKQWLNLHFTSLFWLLLSYYFTVLGLARLLMYYLPSNMYLVDLPKPLCSKMCLKNRHGEDIDQAIASGAWVCPPCRGTCGEGCRTCCNCGPCRKQAGLGPTHQLIKEARSKGFDNVHDFLVHQNSGESRETIAARKAAHSWGAWLEVPFPAAAAVEEAEKEELEPKSSMETVSAFEERAGEEESEEESEEVSGRAGRITSIFSASRKDLASGSKKIAAGPTSR
jgi:hypothetical protein